MSPVCMRSINPTLTTHPATLASGREAREWHQHWSHGHANQNHTPEWLNIVDRSRHTYMYTSPAANLGAAIVGTEVLREVRKRPIQGKCGMEIICALAGWRLELLGLMLAMPPPPAPLGAPHRGVLGAVGGGGITLALPLYCPLTAPL
uniref:Uncharacterized protein n=1 Tax=Eutreptiella gymnastica TaxID=73025 RepID=A0A7S1IZ07_9EUGL|mmetsp:Transcript_5484/g.9759  ORF Transcript_5484/g.9759 Transcript_5484/m.9759 type:complete len:148 (+) Transcript_5484:1332-1775(+)